MIVAGIASVPWRQDTLQLTLRSIVKQVDKVNVFLNGYDTIPTFLTSNTPFLDISKVEVYQSQQYGDLGDAGKHFCPDHLEGYHLCLDDDIIYPPDYAAKMIRKIEEYKRKAVIGVHGTLFKKPIDRFMNSRTCVRFEWPLLNDVAVHMLGTGTLAYHTDTIILDTDRPHKNMDDIDVALKCEALNIPRITTERPERWLFNADLAYDHSIFKSLITSDKLREDQETIAIKQITWQDPILPPKAKKESPVLLRLIKLITSQDVDEVNNWVKCQRARGVEWLLYDCGSPQELLSTLDVRVVHIGQFDNHRGCLVVFDDSHVRSSTFNAYPISC